MKATAIKVENKSKGNNTPFFAPQNGGGFFQAQAKLNIGQTGDKYEQEADRVADQVLRMPDTHTQIRDHSHQQQKIQQIPLIQQKTEGSGNQTASPEVASGIAASRGSGRALDKGISTEMGSKMGADFSGVKVHTDSRALQLSQDLGAKAFTVGNNIYFNKGQYNPASGEGKRLMAHELTHTIQQSGSIQRKYKAKEDAEVISLQENINAAEWKEAYVYLNGQLMPKILEILIALSESEIDKLIINADGAINEKDSVLDEKDKNRCLAAILSVKSVKKSNWSVEDIAIAEQKVLTIPFDQRKEIITFLSGSKSKAAKKLNIMLKKPLLGYTASGYDFSKRFLKKSDKLGFNIESSTQTLPVTPWTGDNPDPQSAHTTDTATKSFEQSDIVFFSGHQYAQYRLPGLYTNDNSNSYFDIGDISKKLKKVKLVVSTSCATICKDVANIYSDKFPEALILGYKYSAPSNGGKVSEAFVESLVKKGPIDLTDTTGLEAVKDSWRRVTASGRGKKGQPGILYKGEVEFYKYKERKWHTAKADSEENDCHYH